MTTPRQYTDAPDPNAYPVDPAFDQNRVDQTRQPIDEFGATGQRVDPPGPQFSGQSDDFRGSDDYRGTDDIRGADTDPSPRHGDLNTGVSQSQSQSVPPTATGTGATSSGDALFAEQDLSELRARWNDVQAAFVDDPRECVQKADSLVSSAVEQLTASFGQTRSRLEDQWQRGEEASTEDLRIALKHYRDFFDRLLSV